MGCRNAMGHDPLWQPATSWPSSDQLQNVPFGISKLHFFYTLMFFFLCYKSMETQTCFTNIIKLSALISLKCTLYVSPELCFCGGSCLKPLLRTIVHHNNIIFIRKIIMTWIGFHFQRFLHWKKRNTTGYTQWLS